MGTNNTKDIKHELILEREPKEDNNNKENNFFNKNNYSDMTKKKISVANTKINSLSSLSSNFNSSVSNLNKQKTITSLTPSSNSYINFKNKEIELNKTYMSPKGSFNSESTKYMNLKEKQLFYFAAGSNISGLRYLLINNVHINTLDEERISPLHIASRCGSLQMVEEIINQGAMVDIPDLAGWTSLHIACYFKRSEFILLLLRNHANLLTRNRDSECPFDLVHEDVRCIEVIGNFVKENQTLEQLLDERIEKLMEDEDENTNSKNVNVENLCKIYLQKNEKRSQCAEGITDSKEKISNVIDLKNKMSELYKSLPKKHTFYLDYNKINDESNNSVKQIDDIMKKTDTGITLKKETQLKGIKNKNMEILKDNVQNNKKFGNIPTLKIMKTNKQTASSFMTEQEGIKITSSFKHPNIFPTTKIINGLEIESSKSKPDITLSKSTNLLQTSRKKDLNDLAKSQTSNFKNSNVGAADITLLKDSLISNKSNNLANFNLYNNSIKKENIFIQEIEKEILTKPSKSQNLLSTNLKKKTEFKSSINTINKVPIEGTIYVEDQENEQNFALKQQSKTSLNTNKNISGNLTTEIPLNEVINNKFKPSKILHMMHNVEKRNLPLRSKIISNSNDHQKDVKNNQIDQKDKEIKFKFTEENILSDSGSEKSYHDTQANQITKNDSNQFFKNKENYKLNQNTSVNDFSFFIDYEQELNKELNKINKNNNNQSFFGKKKFTSNLFNKKEADEAESFLLDEYAFNPGSYNLKEILNLTNVENMKVFALEETDYFLHNISLKEIFWGVFNISPSLLNNFISALFEFDSNIGLLYLMSVYETGNSLNGLIKVLRQQVNENLAMKIMFSKFSEFLNINTESINYFDPWESTSSKKKFLKNFFNSFSYESLSLKSIIKRLNKYLTFSKNDEDIILKFDLISEALANSIFNYSNCSDLNKFRSVSTLHQFIFSILIIDYEAQLNSRGKILFKKNLIN